MGVYDKISQKKQLWFHQRFLDNKDVLFSVLQNLFIGIGGWK